jgi:hypothetical protein
MGWLALDKYSHLLVKFFVRPSLVIPQVELIQKPPTLAQGAVVKNTSQDRSDQVK